MKMPKRPPILSPQEARESLMAPLVSPALGAMLHPYVKGTSTGQYLHWDKFRFQKLETDHNQDRLWTYIRVMRRTSATDLALMQKDQVPFSFNETTTIRKQLHFVDSHARGSLEGKASALMHSDGERYLVRSLIEEPFSSSTLEGAVATRDVARQMVEEDRRPANIDERMVLNNYHAMQFIKEHKNDPLSPELIFELHDIITDGTLEKPEQAGIFRSDTDNIVVGDDFGEVFHRPPTADELPARLESLCSFANQEAEAYIHPIIKAIILHFMIGYDHPFYDGNGRMARALFYWSVLHDDYWLLEYISISSVILEAPTQYGLAYLYTETDEGDLTYFLEHQMSVLEKSLKRLHEYVERKQEELTDLSWRLDELYTDNALNLRQKQLLQEAAKTPTKIYKIAAHQEIHGISRITATKDIEEMVLLGLMTKTKVGREHHYKVKANLAKLLAPALQGRQS